VAIGWGLIVLALSMLAWLGQVVSWLRPELAVRLSLREADADVEPVYASDIRGEAIWDSLSLWTLPLAGLLLVLDQPVWAVFGLIGGGAYLYFAGRGIITRTVMQRSGFRVGAPQSVRMGYVFLAIWGVMALVTMAAAAAALPEL
jgi:hypothetical protein